MFGIQEWVLIVLVIVVLFGASAIPKIARSLGQAKTEFQKGLKNEEEQNKSQQKKAKNRQLNN